MIYGWALSATEADRARIFSSKMSLKLSTFNSDAGMIEFNSNTVYATNCDMARKLDFSRPTIIYDFANNKPSFY